MEEGEGRVSGNLKEDLVGGLSIDQKNIVRTTYLYIKLSTIQPDNILSAIWKIMTQILSSTIGIV